MDWAAQQHHFRWDGTLRDIYIAPTTMADWQRVLARLRQEPALLEYRLDGTPTPLPATVSDMFAAAKSHAVTLACHKGKVVHACHFFSPGQIEFDLDPRNVQSGHDLLDLRHFMTTLARACGRTVLLTHENAPEQVIARVLPTGQMLWP
ncbi:hypothetical protein [Komagataeibacter xylinus]|uniref:hypothetical protein n=1 Tax=Komagataeibacter xylinus TaxID=28448 RepID=UPI001030DEAF|nr:hypothetical protein [Komagataeibacter xylinus]